MDIEISELRQVCEQLLTLCERKGHLVVALPDEHYWDIPSQARYNLYQKPDDLTVGHLPDDWLEVRKIMQSSDFEPTSYSLVWLAAIIRAIGEHTVW